MHTIERHINYLIQTDGCVDVPHIGTFTRYRQSAVIVNDTITPPTENIVFQANANDGKSLIASVAKANDITIEKATGIVGDKCTDIYDSLENGSVDFGDVGMLSYRRGSIIHTPANSRPIVNYPILELKPLHAEKSEQNPELPKYAQTQEVHESFLRSLHRTASSAAAIAILALITFIVTQLPHNNTEAQQASFGIDTTLPVTAVGTTLPTIAEQDASLILIFNTPADASCAVEYPVQNESPVQAPDENRYCMVVASLASLSEAQRFMSAHQGLSLLEKDGRYRVYAASAPTWDELMRIADTDKIFERFPSAWICRR